MKLTIPAGPSAGYIFDCDGTLADTMPLHYRAWKRLVEELGGSFSEQLFYEWGGRPTTRILELLRDGYGLAHSRGRTHRTRARHCTQIAWHRAAGGRALVRVLERFQNLNLLPRRVLAEFGIGDTVHVEVDITGMSEDMLTLIASKLRATTCIRNAYWHRTC